MKVNARTEEFQHIELFDKFALFTNARIDRSTVPEGWYCYDFRGSDDDPGELCYIEKSVMVNHAGSVLMPEELELPASGRLDVRDELGFCHAVDFHAVLTVFLKIHVAVQLIDGFIIQPQRFLQSLLTVTVGALRDALVVVQILSLIHI